MTSTRRGARTGCRVAAAVAAAGGLLVLGPGLRAAAAVNDLPAPPPVPGSPPCPAGDGGADPVCGLARALGVIPLPPGLLGPPAAGGAPRPPAPSATAPAPVALELPTAALDPLGADAASDFANEPFLQSLLDILSHRGYDAGAGLLHFAGWGEGRTAPAVREDGTPAPVPAPPAGEGGPHAPNGGPFPWQVLAPCLVLATASAGPLRRTGAAGAGAPRTRTRRTGRCFTLGAAAASVTLASSGTALATRTVPATAPHPARAPLTAAAPVPVREHSEPRPATAPLWDQLVTLERRLLDGASRLAVVESEIRHILGRTTEAGGAGGAPFRASRVARLVAEHEATAAAYRDCLEIEYGLYRHAAEDPGQRLQLLGGAAATPGRSATDAVTYNLLVAETQAAQERVIARAELLLMRYGSPAEARLRALARHQRFIPPELAPLTQGFGPTDFSMEPPLRYRGTFYPHFHTGIDLAAPLDTPVNAAADGVVLVATASVDGRGRYVGYGNYVLVAHPGGVATLYGHLDHLLVRPGQPVVQGQPVGLEGSTGWSTGPHVHFEIRQDQEVVDPLPLLNR